MHTFLGKTFRFSMIAVCSAIVANGCVFPRHTIASPGTVTPNQYCPGETLTASYDFLRYAGTTCSPRPSAPDECTTAAPTVTMTSNPALFPPTTAPNRYQNSVSFIASGDRIDVSFAYGTTSMFIPPSTILAEVRDNTRTATRYAAPSERLTHAGLCTGMRAPALIPAPPAVPANLRLTRVCNPNPMTVTVILGDASGSQTPPRSLISGECFSTTEPGMPAFAQDAATVDVQSTLDPFARCNGGTAADVLARDLLSDVTLACR